MNIFRRHHIGGNEYITGVRLKSAFFLIVGVEGVEYPEHDDRIGRIQHWSYGQLKDSVEINISEVKFHPHFEQMFHFAHEQELREIEDAKLNSEFYTEDRYETRKLLKFVLKTDRFYETGGYLCVVCNNEKRDKNIAFFRNEGFKAGASLANMS